MPYISKKYVPCDGNSNADIAFVGESPGEDEEYEGKPFIGYAGEKLMSCLARYTLMRDDVFLSNLSKHRPEHNTFATLLNSPELKSGIQELTEELKRVKPNVIVPLGNWPMYFLTGKSGFFQGKPKPGSGIMNWRGSIVECTLPGLEGVKCIPTYHPSYISRNALAYPTFDNDIFRIINDSKFPELRLPEREHVIADTVSEQGRWTSKFLEEGRELAFDIETFGDAGLACCGFSPAPNLGVCFPYTKDLQTIKFIKQILESGIPMIPHFGFFDVNYLYRFFNIETKNWSWDTYVAQRVLDPQLPKTLAYLTSIHTREPYYKYEGKADGDIKSWSAKFDKTQLYIYNSKDVCVTKEIKDSQVEELKSDSFGNTRRKNLRKTFQFDMKAANNTSKHISRTGLLVDQARKIRIQSSLVIEWVKHQTYLNKIIGVPLSPKKQLIPGTDVPQYMNVNSKTQVPFYLYEHLGLTLRRTKEGRVTTDEHAIIAMIGLVKKELDAKKTDKGKVPWLKKLIVLKEILIIRGLRKKKSSYTDFDLGEGGRVRSLFKLAPKTGRWAAEKWIDGTGFNMQTMPRDFVEVEEWR